MTEEVTVLAYVCNEKLGTDVFNRQRGARDLWAQRNRVGGIGLPDTLSCRSGTSKRRALSRHRVRDLTGKPTFAARRVCSPRSIWARFQPSVQTAKRPDQTGIATRLRRTMRQRFAEKLHPRWSLTKPGTNPLSVQLPKATRYHLERNFTSNRSNSTIKLW